MEFVNIYDDNDIDIIIRVSTIERIVRGPRQPEDSDIAVDQYITIEMKNEGPIILRYDDEYNCDDVFEELCDALCEGE